MAPTDLPPVPYKTPVTGESGILTVPWIAFFRQLFNRVGGNTATSIIELETVYVDAVSYGAKGDGVTDDTAAIQAWANALGPGKVGTAEGTFKLHSEITFPANVALELDGAIFDFTNAAGSFPDGACIFFSGGSLVTLPTLASDISNNSRTVSFLAAPNLNRDDVIVLYNSTDYSYSGFRNYYRAGEMLTVYSVSGNNVTTLNNPYASYSIGSGTISAYKLSPTTVHLKGLKILCAAGGTTGNPAALKISMGKNCIIEGVRAYNSNYAHIAIDRCHSTFIHDCVVPKTTPDVSGTSYGIVVSNSQKIIITSCSIDSTRHAITFGGGDVPGAIVNRDIVVDACILASTATQGITALNTHGNCERYSFTNNRLIGGCTLAGNFSKCSGNNIIGDAEPAIECAELSGFTHMVTDNDYQGWIPAISQQGVFLDVAGVSTNFTANTTAGGTFLIENNHIRFDPAGTETANGSNMITIRNRGCTQVCRIIVRGNTFERPYDNTYARNAFYCDVQSGVNFASVEISNNFASGYGFEVVDANYVDFHDNTVFSASAYGFSAQVNGLGSGTLVGASVVGNFITGCSYAGVEVGAASGNLYPFIVLRNNVIVENNLVDSGSSSTNSGAYLYYATYCLAENNLIGGNRAFAARTITFDFNPTVNDFNNTYYGTGFDAQANYTNLLGNNQFCTYPFGRLWLANGTAALPAYTFTSDNTRGMYLESVRLAFAVGGVKRMTLQDYSSGNGTLMFIGDGATSGQISAILSNRSDCENIFGGSTGANAGGQVRVYGDLHATKPNQVELGYGSTTLITGNSTGLGFGAGHTPSAALDFGNPLSAQNGSAAAPSFTFVNASNFGMYYTGARLGFATSGKVRMQIVDNSGSGVLFFFGDATAAQTNGFFSNVSTGSQQFGGDTGASSGGQIRVYGASHATKASYVEFTRGSTVSAYFDGSGNCTFNGTVTATSFTGDILGSASKITGSTGTPQSIVAGTGIAFTGNYARSTWFVKGSGGAVTVTASPPIAAGTTVGQELSIVGCDDTNTVTFTHSAGVLSLNGNITLDNDNELRVRWNGTYWSECYRRKT